MHGAGNRIVVIDGRGEEQSPSPDPKRIAQIADPRFGLAFDQLMWLWQSPEGWHYRVFNTDGSEAEQCGNGARCVVAWLHQRQGLALPGMIHSPSGVVHCELTEDGRYQVALGSPRTAPSALTVTLDGICLHGTQVDMGNPHFVLQCDDVERIELERLGRALNRHLAFPQGVNVEWIDREKRVRVYERGVGETLACGSGACAIAAVFNQQSLVMQWRGGCLEVRRAHDGSLCLSGPVKFLAEGSWLG
jgi:diaminopimelate epimerase